MSEIAVRPAAETDIPGIHRLVAMYAARQILLDRSEEDIRYYLKNFSVAVEAGNVVGCLAVRPFGTGLYEVRSLAVDPEHQGAGIGRAMVEWKIARMREEMPGFRLFALTLSPAFFRRLGFVDTGMEQFPEKFWSDCRNCPKKDRCDEVAVLYAGDNGSGA